MQVGSDTHEGEEKREIIFIVIHDSLLLCNAFGIVVYFGTKFPYSDSVNLSNKFLLGI